MIMVVELMQLASASVKRTSRLLNSLEERHEVEKCLWSISASGYHTTGMVRTIEESLFLFGHVSNILCGT